MRDKGRKRTTLNLPTKPGYGRTGGCPTERPEVRGPENDRESIAAGRARGSLFWNVLPN